MNRLLHCQNNPDDCDCLANMMRRACPQLGGDWMKFMAVMLGPNSNIKKHKHRQHTVLYFPEDCAAVTVKPTAGTLLYLPVGTEHGVTTVKEPRLSVAMLIEERKHMLPRNYHAD